MTEEMHKWDKTFQEFLSFIDNKHEDYFKSNEAEVKSVKDCFATLNGANIKYVPKNLREDIFNEILEKHKEIWGEWHHYAEL